MNVYVFVNEIIMHKTNMYDYIELYYEKKKEESCF